MIRRLFWIFALLVTFCNCSVVRDTPKYQFSDGQYVSRVLNLPSRKVYVDVEEDVVRVYPIRKAEPGFRADTTGNKVVSFTANAYDNVSKIPAFRQTSFDIDFLTIPFKYRFSVNGFPRQFNATLNGAAYLGYRSDVYVLHYRSNFLGQLSRKTMHLGFSFGGFSGLGGTAMNPWVTNNQIAIEYDGVVWSKGIVGIMGFNNFTAGLAAGWDQLLDGNKKFWIYQGKPWIGFAFGLNLN
jgi:hypothetical protein